MNIRSEYKATRCVLACYTFVVKCMVQRPFQKSQNNHHHNSHIGEYLKAHAHILHQNKFNIAHTHARV